jgi:hypothetical protein
MILLSEIGKYKLPEPVIPPVEFMTDGQLQAERGNTFLFDIECFSNYWLAAFKSYQTGRILFFERTETTDFDAGKLRWLVDNMLLVGFNSFGYDIPVLWAALRGLWTDQLKDVSDAIILQGFRPYQVENEFKFKIGHCNHIDLQSVAPSAAAFCSLKHYGARMHVERLQDLPIDPHALLSNDDMQRIRMYCVNDLDCTGWLYHKLRDAIKLREELGTIYKSDLRSLSDAQIAERVIATEIKSHSGTAPERPRVPQGTMFAYQNPDYMQFYTPKMQELHRQILNTKFIVDAAGKVQVLNKEGKAVNATNLWTVAVGSSVYRLGIGGLQSSENNQTVFSDSETLILDRDVASYYPAIILNQNLYPKHIGPHFVNVYRDIVNRRLEAKRAGDKATANSLKICINGCFGKLGSRWSVFYSPDLLIQVTITGQLSLLMLIEMLEWSGIPVISANTDGIVIKCPQDRESDYLAVVADWERITGFETEETRYASIHSRDVNNYFAITDDGTFKAKGAYVCDLSMKDINRETLMKNPNGMIATEAAMLFLKTCRDPDPTTIEKTIKECSDIRKFIFARKVNGGAVKDQQYIGKVIRWYMRSGEFGAIKYRLPNAKGTRNTVSETTGSFPVMDIGEFPKDIDYSWYIRRAHAILKDVGYGRRNDKKEQMLLF